MVLYGDGRQTRDFTFVANVVDANLRALAAPGVGGRVFNVAAGIRVSVLELLETIGRLLGREVRADHQPVRSGEVRDSQAAIDAARDSLGYLPSIPFEEGLRRSIEWYESVFASQ